MSEEMLPELMIQNDRILVRGQIPRRRAHGSSPVLHPTAVIAAVLPDGRILFADKTRKQRAKGCLPNDHTRVLDIFGGHLCYKDLTPEERIRGLDEKTFRRCAARELSEELLIRESDGSLHPFPVQEKKLIPIGLFQMENDHNREISWAYLYPLPAGTEYASVDTLNQNGEELVIPQPLTALSADEAIELSFSQNDSSILIDDAFGRIVQADHGRRLTELLHQAMNDR